MKPKFIIHAPPYTDKSAGIWMLHFLCDRLNSLGYPSSLVFFSTPLTPLVNPKFVTPMLIASASDEIVIYPESIKGNPLNAKHIVRYLLNFDGVQPETKIQWGKNDFPVSYSILFRDDCDILYYPITHLDVFYNDRRKRDGVCLYKGKMHYRGPIPHLDYLEITRSLPGTKKELAEVFRSRALLFSCDSITSTVLDAALCGCVPVLFHPHHVAAELGKFWANDLKEVPAALQVISTLADKVRAYQEGFDEKLASIVARIVEHFGLCDERSCAENVAAANTVEL